MPGTAQQEQIQQAETLQREWETDPRWGGTKRDYGAADVVRLRGSLQEEHTLARRGAEKLWSLINGDDYVNALGALTGNQAVQQVRAGLKAIYLSGWQAAGVHWEDQLSSAKKCGHLGGKVLIPTNQHVKTLNAARLAADVEGVRSIIVARTDAQAATLITSDVDERDKQYITGERTAEG